ncbi:MAG: zinc ribbon domain-containing protein [Clostridia bacterium]|nr:zinc ribbon domain-containing protein [Clostridia bacterium]
MKICQNCGKELAEEFKYCNSCGAEIEETNNKEVVVSTTESTGEQSTVNEYQDIQSVESNDEYISLISKSKTTNLISIGVLVVGIMSLLFINGWLGAVLCFVAEIVALIPNTKIQKLFKSKNPTMDKKSFKTNLKALQKDLKTKSKDFKTSFIIAIIALVCLVLCFVIPSPVTAMFDNEPVESPSIEEIDDVTEDEEDTDNVTTEEPAEIVGIAYYPTVDEFVEDYRDTLNNLYGENFTCRTVDNRDKTTIYGSFAGKEYITIDCTLREDGRIQQISTDIEYGSYCSAYGFITDKNQLMVGASVMVVMPSIVILDYQSEINFSTIEKIKEISYNLLDEARNNKITDTYCMTTNVYDNCTFMYSISFENLGTFHCSCTIFPKDDNDDSTEKTTEKNEGTQSSNTQLSSKVIGGFEYIYSRDATTFETVTPGYPYVNNLRFRGDGTGVITWKTADGFIPYEGVWELNESESEDILLVYNFITDDGTAIIYYGMDSDSCFVINSAENIMYHYQRYTSDK